MSSNFFSLSREICPPSGIDHAVSARFTAADARNVVVARGPVLQVYLAFEEDDASSSAAATAAATTSASTRANGSSAGAAAGDALSSSQSISLTGMDEDLALPTLEPLESIVESDRPSKVARMELYASFRLQGNVTSLGVVPMPGGAADCVLLSFADAKMSLVEFSQTEQKLVTVSMHSYERDEHKKESSIDRPPPEIRVDPLGRCAAMRFFMDKLAILPFKQDLATSNADPDDPANKHPFLPSFVLPFSEIEPSVRNVIDFAFLYGYFEPALAIMFEPQQTWTGRLGSRKDTVSVIVISLDIIQKKYPVLFRIDGLPYNCISLLPAPLPIGGLVILSHNAIIHTDQTHSPGMACVVNGYFDRELVLQPTSNETFGHPMQLEPLPPPRPKQPSVFTTQRAITDIHQLSITLDGARAMFLSPDIMLLVLNDGEMLKVDLIGDEGVGRSWKRRKGGVRRFDVTRLHVRTSSPVTLLPLCDALDTLSLASAASARKSQTEQAGALGGVCRGPLGSRLRYGYVLVTSRATDAQLLQFTEVEDGPKTEGRTLARDADMDDAGSDGDGLDDMDELDAELYGESGAKPKRRRNHDLPGAANAANADAGSKDQTAMAKVPYFAPGTVRFRLCESLVVVSPFRDMAVGQPASYSTHPFANKQPACELEIVSAAGNGVHGSLVVLNRNVRPQIVSSFNLPVMDDMWSVRCSNVHKHKHEAGEADLFHRYIVLSRSTGTSIFETGEEFAELERSAFYSSGPTVSVGTVLGETAIVQIHPNGILLLDSDGTKRQEVPVGDDDKWIVSASIVDPYILLHTNMGDLLLYMADKDVRQIKMKAAYSDELVATCCLYSDETGGRLFPTNAEAAVTHASMLPKAAKGSVKKRSSDRQNGASDTIKLSAPKRPKHTVPDSEDDDLYGDGGLDNGDEDLSGIQTSAANGDHHDDEMDDIYGTGDSQDDSQAVAGGLAGGEELNVDNISKASGQAAKLLGAGGASETRYWCMITTDDGNLFVLSVPDFQERFSMPSFGTLPPLAGDQPMLRKRGKHSSHVDIELEEILVVNLGRSEERQAPFMFVRTSKLDIVVYRIFVCPTLPNTDHGGNGQLSAAAETPLTPKTPRQPQSATSQGDLPSSSTMAAPMLLSADEHGRRLGIRFIRVPHDQITRNLQFYADTEGDKLNLVDEVQKPPSFIKKQHFRPFETIGWKEGNMYAGVFVTGERPCWIMVAQSTRQLDLQLVKPEGEQHRIPCALGTGTSVLRVHPMSVDGPVQCFAPLHNINVPHGFVFINAKGSLRICQLPAQFNFDHDWPVCKVPLGRTVHKIAYHHASQTYAMATSTPEPFNVPRAQYASAVAAAVIDQGEPLPDAERRVTAIRELSELGPGMYEPLIDRYQIELVSPVTWETVDRMEMAEAEQVTSLEAVDLLSKETASGRKLFIAVGTGFMRSEDLTSRGQLHMYDIIDVVPDPNNPQTNHKLKHLCVEEDRSPFSALCTINGYIVAAIGPKIIMYQLEDSELNGVAFMDVNVFVVSLKAVKNLLEICDIHKSLWFVAFQEEPAKLVLLGKDIHPLQGYFADILIDDNQLGLLVADAEKNLVVMRYAPNNVQSLGGQRLLRCGEMYLGQHVSKMIRIMRKPLVRHGTVVPSKQCMAIAGTLDGALVVVTPVSEKMYKRLYGLYSRMVTNLEFAAGLNPRGYRQVQQRVRPLALSVVMGPPGPRGILDGDLLFQYISSLSLTQQRDLAKAIGSRDDRLVDDILEVAAGMDYF
ncbi:CPSF A subunit region-domain-containing protein [Entophlyctis helioformis]|nr:CPSF A subunit region-domain-containing protein [Entophlyctis helioformis]